MIKTKLIYDPISGGGIGEEYINDVIEKLRNNKVDIDLHSTKKVGDAKEVARGIKESEFDVLAIMGGDGTINEVINGLLFVRGVFKVNQTFTAIAALFTLFAYNITVRSYDHIVNHTHKSLGHWLSQYPGDSSQGCIVLAA